jgi:hypothetical protein
MTDKAGTDDIETVLTHDRGRHFNKESPGSKLLTMIFVLCYPSLIRGMRHENLSFVWKGSLTGKAVVLKTTGPVPCRFESCPFRQLI